MLQRAGPDEQAAGDPSRSGKAVTTEDQALVSAAPAVIPDAVRGSASPVSPFSAPSASPPSLLHDTALHYTWQGDHD